MPCAGTRLRPLPGTGGLQGPCSWSDCRLPSAATAPAAKAHSGGNGVDGLAQRIVAAASSRQGIVGRVVGISMGRNRPRRNGGKCRRAVVGSGGNARQRAPAVRGLGTARADPSHLRLAVPLGMGRRSRWGSWRTVDRRVQLSLGGAPGPLAPARASSRAPRRACGPLSLSSPGVRDSPTDAPRPPRAIP